MRLTAKLLVPVLLAAGTVLGTGSAAHAAITSSCNSVGNCTVWEDMGSGACDGQLIHSGNFVYGIYTDTDSGYTCNFWIERNVNNTGWYDKSGVLPVAQNSNSYTTQNYYDGPGYQAEICLQFDWGSSLGAAHCSPAIVG